METVPLQTTFVSTVLRRWLELVYVEKEVFIERVFVNLDPTVRRISCWYRCKNCEIAKHATFQFVYNVEKQLDYVALNKMKVCQFSKRELMIVASRRIMVDKTLENPSIYMSCNFSLDDETVSMGEADQEYFKSASETDPTGLTFDKAAEVARGLAVWHACSSVIVQKAMSMNKLTEPCPIKPYMQPVGRLILELGKNLDLPLILQIGHFHPPDLQLRYRGCGMWDVHFTRVKGHVSSILLDLCYFLCECPVVRKLTPDKDLVQVYYNRFAYICKTFNHPVRCTFQQLRNSVLDVLMTLNDIHLQLPPIPLSDESESNSETNSVIDASELAARAEDGEPDEENLASLNFLSDAHPREEPEEIAGAAAAAPEPELDAASLLSHMVDLIELPEEEKNALLDAFDKCVEHISEHIP